MQQFPDYGVYPWWPEDGDAWIHPEDIQLARQMLPGGRVFRRDGRSGPFYNVSSGTIRLRLRPALWISVPGEGLDVGDRVQVLSRLGKNQPRIGTICDMHWQFQQRRIVYHLWDIDCRIPEPYLADDLERLEPLAPPDFIRIEPAPYEPLL